jgi:hypothetical protein
MWSGSGSGEGGIRAIGAKRGAARAARNALQDLALSEVPESEAVAVHKQSLSRGADLAAGPLLEQQELALQDLASCQVPLLAGVVSLLIGEGLQDRFADFTRELVDRGRRVLAAER